MTTYEKAARQAQVELETAAIDRELKPAAALDVTKAARRKPKALLVVHGMGQQLRFETLDAVANGLHKEDVRRHRTEPSEKPKASPVRMGGQRLERIEMLLREGPDSEAQPVHVYEAYWSPLTEGAVTLRDVMRFLYRAGFNGLRNSSGRFVHWAFGQKQERDVPVQTLVFLLLALCVVAALMVINTAIVLVPAARSPFVNPPGWLSDALFRDLTDVFDAALIVMLGFGLLIGVSMLASRWHWTPLRKPLGLLSIIGFVLALFAILAAAVAVPVLITLHGSSDLEQTFLPEIVRTLGRWTPYIVLGIAAIAVVWYGGRLVLSLVLGWFRQFGTERWGRSTAVIVIFSLMIYALVELAVALMASAGQTLDSRTRDVLFEAPVWAALAGVGLLVRGFLVQYLGDVAAYVESHTIDRFHELRAKIKESVWKTAHAIYSQKSDGHQFDYDEIVIAGHSLGSVAAYDVLNRLLLEDATGGQLDAMQRTRMLLTFGSPLDKTAFVFANQSKGKRMTPAREALGALVQPLIDNKAVRDEVEWVNVYSPWDIISGRLDYYDDPCWKSPQDQKPRVINEPDREALTLLAAHVEYWRNWHVFARLYSALNPLGPALQSDARTGEPAAGTARPDAKAA